jgi:hypothetical protein
VRSARKRYLAVFQNHMFSAHWGDMFPRLWALNQSASSERLSDSVGPVPRSQKAILQDRRISAGIPITAKLLFGDYSRGTLTDHRGP